MLVLIFVITAVGAEGTRPPCLISGLIFHFIAHLSISNKHKWLNLHDRICNTANQVSASIKHYTGALS